MPGLCRRMPAPSPGMYVPIILTTRNIANETVRSAAQAHVDIGMQASGDTGANAQEQLTLLYHVGLQHLLLGRPAAALGCFRGAAPALLRQPLLWLRMAEAAISMHTMAASDAARASDAASGDAASTTTAPGGHQPDANEGGAGSEAERLLADAAMWLRTARQLADLAIRSQPAAEQLQVSFRVLFELAFLRGAVLDSTACDALTSPENLCIQPYRAC